MAAQEVPELTEDKFMRAVLYKPGGPDGLHIACVPIPELTSGQILIRVFATAINRADTLQRQGKYPPPPGESDILGLEAAGLVEKVGANCNRFKEGDRVMALLGGGGYAEFVAASEELVMPVPTSFSFKEAASIPETWLTAYQLLHFVGKLQQGEKVLIHAAGSGVGLAAIQMAKSALAYVMATAGTQAKLDMALSLGAQKGFNYREGSYSSGVLAATEGLGTNLILDCVGGSFWEQNSESIATDGRWVLYGLLGGPLANGDILARILRKRIRLEGSTLRNRSLQYKAALVSEFSAKILPLLENGILKPVIDSDFTLGRVAEAHSLMEADKNIGKIVLLVRPGADLPPGAEITAQT